MLIHDQLPTNFTFHSRSNAQPVSFSLTRVRARARVHTRDEGRKGRKNVPKWITTGRCCCYCCCCRCCYESLHARAITRRGRTGRTSFSPDDMTSANDCQPDLRFRETDTANRANHRASVSAAWRHAPLAMDAPPHALRRIAFPRESMAVDSLAINRRRDAPMIVSRTTWRARRPARHPNQRRPGERRRDIRSR